MANNDQNRKIPQAIMIQIKFYPKYPNSRIQITTSQALNTKILQKKKITKIVCLSRLSQKPHDGAPSL